VKADGGERWRETAEELARLAAAGQPAPAHPVAGGADRHRANAARLLIVAAFLGLTGFLAWASRAKLEQVVRAEGKVIPSGSTHAIQSLEGGIVKEIAVREGQRVKAGDVLARLHEVQFEVRYRENVVRRDALRCRLVRLRAEAEGKPELEFPEELRRDVAEYVATELLLFEKRREDIESNRKVLDERADAKERELALLRPIFEQGAMSEVRKIELESEIADIKGQLATAQTAFRRKAMEEFDAERSKLREIEETIRADEDKLARTALHSPANGIVNKIFVENAGRVIQGGQPIMEIVPMEGSLLVEAKIRPQDIGFVKVGQSVRLRFTAYDFTAYGGMDGHVETLGVDTVKGEGQGQAHEVYYPVRVRTSTHSLGKDRLTGEDLVLKPGMVAEVDFLGGERSLLEYMLKPIQRARRLALRER
jgi:adhesin transport system membrane fusion protein